ncbi:zinc-binding dehydrogenase [Microbacterium foliorum]
MRFLLAFCPNTIALAKRAGAYVIATASPRSADAVRAAGADEIIAHTETEVLDAVTEQVDLLLNLAPIEPDEFTALVRLVRDGGVVVSTTAWMPAPDDADRGVRSVVVFVRSDAAKLAELVSLVDGAALTLEVTRRIPLTELPALHAEAAEGPIAGKGDCDPMMIPSPLALSYRVCMRYVADVLRPRYVASWPPADVRRSTRWLSHAVDVGDGRYHREGRHRRANQRTIEVHYDRVYPLWHNACHGNGVRRVRQSCALGRSECPGRTPKTARPAGARCAGGHRES